ncbi:MAG: orotate phosphoribosyltransferase [Planctomycetota bacterium]|jgi:orotate phosphoribosyltransferase
MQTYKQDFIEFLVRCEVLTFGDFTTKSGRKTPYFVNTGRYCTGSQLTRLGGFYAAAAIEHLGEEFDLLFGPAYKGIPLVVSMAQSMAAQGRDIPFCFNRKEAKDHGEGGVLVGHAPKDAERVLIVEDVTTAGTSIRETVPILRAAADVKLAGLVVSVDRQERGKGDRPALEEVGTEFKMPTFAIVTLDEILEFLTGREVDGRTPLGTEERARIDAYRTEYGA